MGRAVAIVQSSYIPWRGYFDLINSVDHFVLLDDVQYTRQDWRNRNLIKTSAGLRWLTIPVQQHGCLQRTIAETRVSDASWGAAHWRRIVVSYEAAEHFATYRGHFAPLYADDRERSLSLINRRFIEAVCALLGIRTTISWSSDHHLHGGRTERLISLCQQLGASTYVSGPAARSYLDPAAFAGSGIALRFFDYGGYPNYLQLHPPFEGGVSILDLLFNLGPAAPRYMKSFAAAPEE